MMGKIINFNIVYVIIVYVIKKTHMFSLQGKYCVQRIDGLPRTSKFFKIINFQSEKLKNLLL